MELFELSLKEKANFLLKLVFLKVRCLINVNKIVVSLDMDERQQNG